MRTLEHDLGIQDLSECERDILCAPEWLGNSEEFDVGAVLGSSLYSRYSRPTIFRAIKSLQNAGWIEKIGSPRSGTYVRVSGGS